MDNKSKNTRRNTSNSNQVEVEDLISYLQQSKDKPSAQGRTIGKHSVNSAVSTNSAIPKSAEKTVFNDIRTDISAQTVPNKNPSTSNIQKEKQNVKKEVPLDFKSKHPVESPNTRTSAQKSVESVSSKKSRPEVPAQTSDNTKLSDQKTSAPAKDVSNTHSSAQKSVESVSPKKSRPEVPVQTSDNTKPSDQKISATPKDVSNTRSSAQKTVENVAPKKSKPEVPAQTSDNTKLSDQKISAPAKDVFNTHSSAQKSVESVSPKKLKPEVSAQTTDNTRTVIQNSDENADLLHTEPVVNIHLNTKDSGESDNVKIDKPKKSNFVTDLPTNNKSKDDNVDSSDIVETYGEIVNDEEFPMNELSEDIDNDNRIRKANHSLYLVKDQPVETHPPVFISLSELLLYVIKNIYIIILTVIIGGAGMYIVSSKISSPMYTSTSKIIIFINEEEDETSASWNDLQFNFSVMTDCTQVVTSRDVVENVIKELNLDTDYNTLVKNIHVSVMQNSRIMEISVTYKDPIVAMNILKQLRQTAFEAIHVALEVDHYKIIQYENLPHSPSENNTNQHIVLGMGMGFVLGFAIIFVFFYSELIQKNKRSQKKHAGY